jgi:cysteine-rich CWC protein
MPGVKGYKREVLNETSEREYSPSVCDSCGEEFGCGAKLDGCWCNDLKLDPGAAEFLKNKFDACLCPKCLKTFAEAKPDPNAN